MWYCSDLSGTYFRAPLAVVNFFRKWLISCRIPCDLNYSCIPHHCSYANRPAANVHTQTSPAHQATAAEIGPDKYDSHSTPVDVGRWSRTDSHLASEIDFSLTAPNTFSDGLWLIDRSEGEVPCPIAPEAYERMTNNADLCLRTTASHLSASLTSGMDDDEQASGTSRLSDGEFPPPKPTTSSRPGPTNNPLLELMALQQSTYFHGSSLTNHERDQVQRIASDLRKAHKQAHQFDWLISLSGLGDRIPSRNMSNPISSCSVKSTDSDGHLSMENQKEQMVEHTGPRLTVRSDESGSSRESLSVGENPSIEDSGKPAASPEAPDQHKQSPTDTLEMVHAVDSDASTLNDPVYEDDYVTDSTA
ncbi:unnamed protein product [Echinostoma caproni]|uniref:Uncharacterized protein n=1 Tax=Echinostoma caproni TaxID=27848 RepID=A0A183AF75_9TREM|nr:unnamed protein product [Echinostoma caproni]